MQLLEKYFITNHNKKISFGETIFFILFKILTWPIKLPVFCLFVFGFVVVVVCFFVFFLFSSLIKMGIFKNLSGWLL